MSAERQSTQSKVYPNQFMPDGGKEFYLDEQTADVHFLFDSDDCGVERIPGHKILLAAASDVFKRMFYGELKESGDVNVVDASDAAFKEFLQYFYLNEVKLTEENVVGVMGLGHKYNVKKCFDDGIQFLTDALNDENVCSTSQIANIYSHAELLKACETLIIVNTEAVFKSTDFVECDKIVLAHILKMNILSCSETEAFKACMAWVKAKSEQDLLSKALVEQYLGDLYFEIRFASMTIQEFCSFQTEYESVLQNDYSTIINMIVLSEFQGERFNKHPRHAKWDADAIVKCDRALNNQQRTYKFTKAKYYTIFSTNKALLLGEFTCGKIVVGHTGPDRDLSWDLLVDVEISEANDSEDANSKTLLKMKAKLQSKDTNVSLPHPLLIRPGFFYSICIGKFPDEHCYYSNELKTEVRLESDVTIKFHKCNHDLENVNIVIGPISVLNFNQI